MTTSPVPLHITDLPFNQFMGIEVDRENHEVLILPEADRYTNHVGTVHAAALYALAEACCGHRLLLSINGAVDRFLPLLRRCTVKYSKPARGVIHARSVVEDGAFEKMRNDLRENGRALINIDASLWDENDTEVMAASCLWFVQAVGEET